MAAHRAGIKTVIYPADNQKDLVEVPETIRSKMTFVPVAIVDEVFQHAFAGVAERIAKLEAQAARRQERAAAKSRAKAASARKSAAKGSASKGKASARPGRAEPRAPGRIIEPAGDAPAASTGGRPRSRASRRGGARRSRIDQRLHHHPRRQHDEPAPHVRAGHRLEAEIGLGAHEQREERGT